MQGEERRSIQLAQFLQTRRARLSPKQAGLPSGGRRRTPGLRRAEVAYLAGVSVDWYTWLEQGRDIQASAQVLESVARALQLDRDERKHLFLLAYGHLPPEHHDPQITVSPLLQNFLDRQGDSPAFVTNSRWDIVAWNRAACFVFGDYGKMTAREKNSVWRMYTSSYVRQLLQDEWEHNARRRLAQFRAGYGKFVGDPWWSEMIEALSRVSTEFREWWPQHDVQNAPEGRKIIYHPIAGTLYFEHLSFQAIDSADLQVTVNIPMNESTSERMRKQLGAESMPNV